jgi:predicted nucleic acid-binding protein
LFISAVTIGEIQAGIELTREQDPTTAKVHHLTVVTRNIADFRSFGVGLFNPLDGASY